MRLAFNATLLSYAQWYRSAGISRYIDRTVAHLGPLLRDDPSVAFVNRDFPQAVPGFSWHRVLRTTLPTNGPYVRILWEQVVLPILLRRFDAEIFHSPAYAGALGSSTPTVITFHDLSFFAMPEAFNRANRLYLQRFSQLSARRAARLIAVSEHTRQDLITLLGIPKEKIDVVYNGVDERFHPEADLSVLAHFRQRQGLPDRFLLHLGTLEPRKNVGTLLRAYALARRRGVTEPLVLAGGRGWRDGPALRLVDELGLRDAVLQPGFVPMEEQPLWYNAATLLAYPSLYEGFGMPVLEAMACGTPVITSNRSSLPEVVGDAGVLVDPESPDDLADALVRVLGDKTLREDLARRGRERSARFTWSAAADATIETYRRALNSPVLAPRLD